MMVVVHAFEPEALTKAGDVVRWLVVDHVGDGGVMFVHVCYVWQGSVAKGAGVGVTLEAVGVAIVSLVVVGTAFVFTKAKSSVTGETSAGGGISTKVFLVDREVLVVAEGGHGVCCPY